MKYKNLKSKDYTFAPIIVVNGVFDNTPVFFYIVCFTNPVNKCVTCINYAYETKNKDHPKNSNTC